DCGGYTRTCQRGKIGGMPHTTRCLPREIRKSAHSLPIQLDVGPAESAIALDVGTQNVLEQAAAIAADRVPQTDRSSFGPAPSPHARDPVCVQPDIESQADPLLAIPLEPGRNFIGPLDRQTSNYHAADAFAKQLFDRVGRAHTAANLQPDCTLCE